MIGQMLAHYEIVGSLGKGGMGEVWRALDTRLEREVAIKTLPSAFAQDAERLARFEREAKLLAALNHPHIAAVYGLDEHEGTRFLVMELVEGQTLDQRLQHGALPVDDALLLARQIAEALEAAHDKGVVHRDLKPANVMITREGNVKVLDFGLAKAFAGNPLEASPAHSPALSLAMTQAGLILGTAGYMSPEQASGQATDQRADVWSFGVVVYEMLSGQPLFTGESVPHILAGILRTDPDWTRLPKPLHPRMRQMLERCLTKRPRDRYHSIADARVDIDAALADPGGAMSAPAAAAPSASRSVMPWVAAALLAVLVGAAAWIFKPSPAPEPALVARFAQVLAPEQNFRNMGRDVVAVSPDGRQIVYNTSAGIVLRVLDEVEPRIVPGTDTAITNPFFSPDGEWIGYYDGGRGELRKIRVSGGASVLIATASNPMGASWSADGTIVFGQPAGIMRVSGDGGPVELVASANESEQLWDPQVLPNGAVLFTAWTATDDGTVAVAGPGAVERTELFPGERAVYVPTGHLVVSDPWASPNTLLARTFDPDSLDFGGAVPIEERVAVFQGKTHYALSPAGSLVYVFGEGTGGAQRPQRTLTWIDRNGEETPLALPPDDYTTARISPDGTKVALVIGSVIPISDPPPDIWILDLETDTFRQLTFNAEVDDMPVWSRDSDRIYYRSFRDGTAAIYSIPWDGGDGQAMLVGSSAEFGFPSPWSISPDEGLIAFNYGESIDNINLATLSLAGDAEFTSLLAEPGMESEPVIAPNGQWMAYQLTQIAQGVSEINVRPFPGVAPQRIPVVQGSGPVFSADGTELFYFDGDGISVFEVGYEPGFFRRNGRSLFRRSYQYGSAGPNGGGGRAWDVHPSAERFLMINLPGVTGEQGEESTLPRIHIVLNWFEELSARARRP